MVKISTVVSAENILIEITLRVHVVVRRIMSHISGCTGPIFAIFSPYESTLRDHDGSVSYFPVYQETLPWQPKMFPNESKQILRAFFARSPDGSTVSFCYNLVLIPLYGVKFWRRSVQAENSLTYGTCVRVNALGISY